MSDNPSDPNVKVADAKSVSRVRRRRKEARPSEIIEAAIVIFSERGFGATKLEDVARRAGVSKGTLFVYFQSKEELFRSVAQTVLSTHLEKLRHVSTDLDQSLEKLVPTVLALLARLGDTGVPAIVRLLVAESRTFPDLARVWHDEVVSKVLGLLTAAIRRAQARSEIRPGDPQLYALSIIGPMAAAVLFREIFKESSISLPDLQNLSLQHAQTVLFGLINSESRR